jgi:hypothetical protein
MIGLIKNGENVPFISLENFIDGTKLNNVQDELHTYLLEQENNGADVFVGYNGTDWASDEFQSKQKNTLPKTYEYISSFCKEGVPFNIRYSPKEQNIVLLHQDDAAQLDNRTPLNALVPNYKDYLNNSVYDLLLDKDNFKIVKNIDEVNPIYNGLDFDYNAYLEDTFKENYIDIVKGSYKLHLIISPEKSIFVYDNVTDTIHHIDSKATVFNAKDYHDTLKDSWGISIQFPMNPSFFNDDIKEYCELSIV